MAGYFKEGKLLVCKGSLDVKKEMGIKILRKWVNVEVSSRDNSENIR